VRFNHLHIEQIVTAIHHSLFLSCRRRPTPQPDNVGCSNFQQVYKLPKMRLGLSKSSPPKSLVDLSSSSLPTLFRKKHLPNDMRRSPRSTLALVVQVLYAGRKTPEKKPLLRYLFFANTLVSWFHTVILRPIEWNSFTLFRFCEVHSLQSCVPPLQP
jgi:hypothetical protein